MLAAGFDPGASTGSATPLPVRGRVVQHPHAPGHRPDGHEAQSRAAVARKLARLLNYEWHPHYEETAAQPCYFVPDDTLPAADARKLGIRSSDDFFGGIVPHAFMAHKTIAHPLVARRAAAPEGWSTALAAHLGKLALPGYSAFSADDARRAVRRVLALGPARLKLAEGIGGSGQYSIADAAAFESVLGRLPETSVAAGMVIELNLQEDATYSVGQVCVGDRCIAYCGKQRQTLDNAGRHVYGGSSLLVARGTFETLLRQPLPADCAAAVRQARLFDAAVALHMPGFLASRRNYDVISGRDAAGNTRSGVLEQSWRIGGASPAELAALEAFDADPQLTLVRSACHEVYGTVEPPPGAEVYFSGTDARAGPLTKYSLIERPPPAKA